MSISGAQIVWGVVGVYSTVGVAFALAFAWRGVERLDRRARGASWICRLAFVPAGVALWPWLAWRWLQVVGGRRAADNVESSAP